MQFFAHAAIERLRGGWNERLSLALQAVVVGAGAAGASLLLSAGIEYGSSFF